VRRVSLVLLSSAIALTSSSIGSMALAAEEEVQEPPTVCQDQDGQLKKGQIDVLVLMDNSGSLEAKNQVPTDPDRLRFSALDEFVDNYARLSSAGKNFGLIKFSTTAEEVIPLGPISSGSTDSIKNEIRTKLGEADGPTDYVQAFAVARRVLESRPSENCKILIWFTDGVYDTLLPSENADDSLVAKDLRKLESNFCDDDGFARFVQNEDINTFVVFLGTGGDRSAGSQARRLEASVDVMQVLTGDEAPSFPDGSPREVVGDTCSKQMEVGVRHLGDVVSAAEASDLLGYLTDLVNIADGGKPVVQGECPISTTEVETLPLPSGQLIDWISITAWDEGSAVGNPDSLARTLKVRVGVQESDLDEYFVLSSSSSGNVQRLVVRPENAGSLAPGWKLMGEDLGRICIRAKPHDLKFRISGDKLMAVSPSPDLAPNLFDGRTSLFIGEDSVSIAEAASRSSEAIVGVLQVENGEVFNPESTLPVSIEVSELPIVLNERCRIEVLGTREASDEQILSTSCQVFPSPTSVVRINASSLLGELSSCGIGEWFTTVNGVQSEIIEPGNEGVSVGLATRQGPGNRKITCNLGSQSVLLEMTAAVGGSSSTPQIEALVNFDLVKKANPTVAIVLAAIATAIVALLSLILLRLVNDQLSKTVRPQDYFGYEADVDVVVSESGRGELRIDGQPARSFVGSIDSLQTVDGNKKQTSLRFGSIEFQRQLPGFLRPFEESRLKLKSQLPAVFWKANRASDGLQMTFPSAAILVALKGVAPTKDAPARGRLSLLVPKRGFDSGVAGVEKLVKERGDDLASELVRDLSLLENAQSKARESGEQLFGVQKPTNVESPKTSARPSGPPRLGGVSGSSSSTDAPRVPPSKPQGPSRPPGPPKRPN
jgi:hypothetical protein